MDKNEEKMINIDKRLITLETTFKLQMKQISKDINLLSQQVAETSNSQQKFLNDVQAFIRDVTSNYVPLSTWKEHIKEDAMLEQKVEGIENRVVDLESFKQDYYNVKKSMAKNYRMYLYPVLLNLIITCIEAFVAYVVLKFKGLL